RLQGRIDIGGQGHFYPQGQVSLAIPPGGGGVLVPFSTPPPSEGQHLIAPAPDPPREARTGAGRGRGGGCRGHEAQSGAGGIIAALVTVKTGRAAKFRLDRDDDMIMTGKRHPFRIEYAVGFDETGRIRGIEFTQAADCGFSADLSGAIADRAMFHADNGYYLDNVRITSHRCKTNLV